MNKAKAGTFEMYKWIGFTFLMSLFLTLPGFCVYQLIQLFWFN